MTDFGTAMFAESKSRSRQASGRGVTSSQSTVSSQYDGKVDIRTLRSSPFRKPAGIPFQPLSGIFPSTDDIYIQEQSFKTGEQGRKRFKRGISVGMINLLKIWDFFELTDEGGIDKVGFEMGLQQLGVEEDACNLDNVFTELDENNDKIIDKNEFSRLVKSEIRKLSPEVAKLRKAIERTVKYTPNAREATLEKVLQSDFPLKEMDETIKGESGSDSEPRIRNLRNMCKDIFRSLDFRHQGYLDVEEFLVALSRLRFQNVEKYRSTFDQYVMFQSPVVDLADLMTLVLYISGDEPLEPRLWEPLKERDIRLVFEDLDYKGRGLTAFEVGLAAERLGVSTPSLDAVFSKYSRRNRVSYSSFNKMLSLLGNNDRCHPVRRPKIPLEPHDQINKVFKQLDHNGSGTLNSMEFCIGCRWLGLCDNRNNVSEFQYRSTDGKIDCDGFQGAIESLWVRHDIQVSRLSERLSFDIHTDAAKSYSSNMSLLDIDNCHYINLAESIVAAQRMEIKFDLSWIQTHFATYDYTSHGWIHQDLFVSLMAELDTKSDPSKSKWATSPDSRDRDRPTRESYGSAHVKMPDMNLQPSSRLRPSDLPYPMPSGSPINKISIFRGSVGSSPLVSGKRFPSNRSDGSRASIRFDKIKSLLYSPRDVELKTQEKLQTLEIQKRDSEIAELKKKIEELNSKAESQNRLHKDRLEQEKEKLSLKTMAIESSRDHKLATMAKNQLSMESELQEAIHEARDLRRRLTESEAEKLQLQREIRQELAELEDEYCELEADCEMYVQENNSLKDELEEVQRKYRDLEEELENLGEQNAELREDIRQSRKDHKEISKKYKTQNDKLKEFEVEAAKAMAFTGRRDQNEILKMRQKAIFSKKRDSEFKVKTFNETLRFLQDHTKIMTEFKVLWKEKKNTYKRRIVDLKNEIKHLRKDYDKLKKMSRHETFSKSDIYHPGIGGAPLNMVPNQYSQLTGPRRHSHASQKKHDVKRPHRRSFEI